MVEAIVAAVSVGAGERIPGVLERVWLVVVCAARCTERACQRCHTTKAKTRPATTHTPATARAGVNWKAPLHTRENCCCGISGCTPEAATLSTSGLAMSDCTASLHRSQMSK